MKYPNVNQLIEMTDLRDAQRSYSANLNVINATRAMIITLFNFARQRGYLPKNQPTEAESITVATSESRTGEPLR